MNKRFDLGKTMSLFLTFLLVISRVIPVTSAPVFAFAENPSGAIPSDGEAFWDDSIPEMLAAGEYEEGVVIAGIDMSKAKQSEDPGAALETEMFAEDTEELICVDSGDLTTGQDFYVWHKCENIQQREDGRREFCPDVAYLDVGISCGRPDCCFVRPER